MVNKKELKRLKTYSISSGNRKKILACALAVFLITALVYLNTLKNDFIWDDEYLILNNSQIKSFSHFPNIFRTYVGYGSENVNTFYRPLQELSNMIDYFLWKKDAFGFHLTNMMLHALAAALVFIFVFYVCGNAVISFFAGALFGVHPIHTEAVSYIAGRADSLYSIFFLLSFVYFIKYANHLIKKSRRAALLFLSVIFFILSVLSKEISLILPLLLVLFVYAFLKSRIPENNFSTIRKSLIPYGAIIIVYGILRFTVLNFFKIAPPILGVKIPLANRLFTFFTTVPVYLKLLVFPLNLHMERTVRVVRYIADPTSLFSFIFVIGLIAAGFLVYRRHRVLSFFIFWFFVNLLPVSNIVPINSFIAEHWLYMASIGYFFIVANAFYLLYIRYSGKKSLKKTIIASAVVLFFWYSFLTVERNKDWKDEETFFKSTLRYRPQDSRLYLNFGNTYYEKEEYDKALEQYEKVLSFKKNDSAALGNIGSVYMAKGDLKKAEEYIKMAVAADYNTPLNHKNLAHIYYNTGRKKEAVQELEISLKQLPQLYQSLNLLGRIYLEEQDKRKALEMFQRSLAIMPNQPEIKRLLEKIQ